MAMGDRGLALPRELSDCFPEPSDFSADAFHNRSAHTESIHEARPRASAREAYPHYPPELVLARWTELGLPLTANIARLSESRGMLRARLRLLRVTMRAVGNHRGARTISLALVAGLAAFEAVLLLGAGAIGIPGVLLVRSADQGGGGAGMPSADGVCRRRERHRQAPVPDEPAKPTPVEVCGGPHLTAPAGEARLDGLADIPAEAVGEREAESGRRQAGGGEPAAGSEVGDALPWDAVEPVPAFV